MKKRIATLLMLAFSTALLLGGCGESSEKEAVNKESDNSSAGVLSKITGTKNCIELSKSGSFLTREVMDIDSLDSKNILIDLSSDEKNELFREEVMSRYE